MSRKLLRSPQRALTGRLVSLLVFCTLLVAVHSGAAQPAASSPAKRPDGLKKEFFGRLARVAPRSATAHVELAAWCRQAGLEEYATQCCKLAISIDSDCEKARTALGYKRHGEGWIKPGEKPASQPVPVSLLPAGSPVPTSRPATSPGTGAAAKPAAPKPASPPPAATSLTQDVQKIPVPGAGAGEKPDPAAAEQKKLAWADAAAAKLATTFYTHKDNDFLVHTTLSRSSRDFKVFLAFLKLQKKTLTSVLGLKTNARIWPEKLQFFLMRSRPDFERFGELVDGLKSVNTPEGAYTVDDHTVVLKPDTEVIPRLLGRQALVELNGSDRYVSWWISEGLSNWMYAQSPTGIQRKYYQSTMLYAAEVIRAEGAALKIFSIVDSAAYPKKEANKSRALAFTLVDFLIQYRRKGFQDLVKALKSPEAPEPPADPEKSTPADEQFQAFFGAYVSFQEEAIRSAFRKPVDDLGERWKRYVLENASRFQNQAPPDSSTPTRRGRRTR